MSCRKSFGRAAAAHNIKAPPNECPSPITGSFLFSISWTSACTIFLQSRCPSIAGKTSEARESKHSSPVERLRGSDPGAASNLRIGAYAGQGKPFAPRNCSGIRFTIFYGPVRKQPAAGPEPRCARTPPARSAEVRRIRPTPPTRHGPSRLAAARPGGAPRRRAARAAR
jgi:hypothetical protein